MKKLKVIGLFLAVAIFQLFAISVNAQTDTLRQASDTQSFQVGFKTLIPNQVTFSDHTTEFTIFSTGEYSGKDYQYEFDNPVSAVPSKIKEVYWACEDCRQPKVVDTLFRYIYNLGFFDMMDAYGAPENERNYLSRITLTYKGEEKTILFRSNPQYDGMPEVFRLAMEAMKKYVGRTED